MSPSVVRAAFRERWRREKVRFQGCVGELRRRDAADARAGFGVVGEVGEIAARLAIARPDGSWALGLRARGSPDARWRGLSAPQISEGAAERTGPGLTPRLPGPLRGVSTKAGPGDG